MLRLDDLTPGLTLPCGSHAILESELVAFAREHDPQPMHLDAASEQAKQMGGLIGSGWQTAALSHRMLRDGVLDPAGLDRLLGVTSLRWSNPVRPGDTLTGLCSIVGQNQSAGPGAALTLQHTLTNQRGETVMALEARYARGPAPAAPLLHGPLPDGPYPATQDKTRPMPFDAIVPGAVGLAGEQRFSAEAIQRYRTLYDPAAAGEKTASPWHVAAQWLRTTVDRYHALEAAGEALPQRGPGLGLTDVVWPSPVRVDEVIRYFSRVVSARPSASRPGWGIVSNRNYALNAQGEVVVAFSTAVLLEGRAS